MFNICFLYVKPMIQTYRKDMIVCLFVWGFTYHSEQTNNHMFNIPVCLNYVCEN